MHYNNRCSRISGKASGVFHGWVSASARSRAMAAQGRREARRRLRGRRRPAAAHSGSRRSIRGRAAPQGPPATHPRGGGNSRKDRERLICCLPAAPRTAGGAARLQRLPQRVGHRTARVHVRDGGIALPQELDAVVTPDVIRPRSAGQSIVCI